jgi:hypothetical protein
MPANEAQEEVARVTMLKGNQQNQQNAIVSLAAFLAPDRFDDYSRTRE